MCECMFYNKRTWASGDVKLWEQVEYGEKVIAFFWCLVRGREKRTAKVDKANTKDDFCVFVCVYVLFACRKLKIHFSHRVSVFHCTQDEIITQKPISWRQKMFVCICKWLRRFCSRFWRHRTDVNVCAGWNKWKSRLWKCGKQSETATWKDAIQKLEKRVNNNSNNYSTGWKRISIGWRYFVWNCE